MIDMNEIAVNADMIINGYAFTRMQAGIQIVSLERGTACVLNVDGSVLESSMDDIELDIVIDYYSRNKKFMED